MPSSVFAGDVFTHVRTYVSLASEANFQTRGGAVDHAKLKTKMGDVKYGHAAFWQRIFAKTQALLCNILRHVEAVEAKMVFDFFGTTLNTTVPTSQNTMDINAELIALGPAAAETTKLFNLQMTAPIPLEPSKRTVAVLKPSDYHHLFSILCQGIIATIQGPTAPDNQTVLNTVQLLAKRLLGTNEGEDHLELLFSYVLYGVSIKPEDTLSEVSMITCITRTSNLTNNLEWSPATMDLPLWYHRTSLILTFFGFDQPNRNRFMTQQLIKHVDVFKFRQDQDSVLDRCKNHPFNNYYAENDQYAHTTTPNYYRLDYHTLPSPRQLMRYIVSKIPASAVNQEVCIIPVLKTHDKRLRIKPQMLFFNKNYSNSVFAAEEILPTLNPIRPNRNNRFIPNANDITPDNSKRENKLQNRLETRAEEVGAGRLLNDILTAAKPAASPHPTRPSTHPERLASSSHSITSPPSTLLPTNRSHLPPPLGYESKQTYRKFNWVDNGHLHLLTYHKPVAPVPFDAPNLMQDPAKFREWCYKKGYDFNAVIDAESWQNPKVKALSQERRINKPHPNTTNNKNRK